MLILGYEYAVENEGTDNYVQEEQDQRNNQSDKDGEAEDEECEVDAEEDSDGNESDEEEMYDNGGELIKGYMGDDEPKW